MQAVENMIDGLSAEELIAYRQELLDYARRLDHMGRRFERFMSIQLQHLELAVDDFNRERESWRRQKDREADSIGSQIREGGSGSYRETLTTLTDIAEQRASDAASGLQSPDLNGHLLSPLRVLIEPGQATPMQVGLLFFEISKFNRELGGGGIRFEVSTIKRAKSANQQDGKHSSIVGLEAFSFLPLVAYDGQASQQIRPWEQFKAQMLMSSLVDSEMLKRFSKGSDAPRDDAARALAFEATRRADNANNKCDITQARPPKGVFLRNQKKNTSTGQQMQRIEDVVRYLKSDCGLRIHVSLVW